MYRKGCGPFLAILSLSFLSCSEPGTETWPVVQDAVSTMLMEFDGAFDAEGRSPVIFGTWETGQERTGESIPTKLLDRLSAEVGITVYSEELGLRRERTGFLTLFEPRELASDTLGITATWVFPEANGGWHFLEFDFLYRCSRFGCKRHRYFQSGILN